jgi:hypothetical protein
MPEDYLASSLRIQDVIFKTKPRHRFVVFMTKASFFIPQQRKQKRQPVISD